MAEQFFSLGGHRAITGRLTRPFYGPWTADIVLADDSVEQGAIELTLGDLTLQGVVRPGRMAKFGGKAAARLIGGKANGWKDVIEAKGYSHDAGLKLSVLLEDAARAAGEKINVPSANDKIVGTVWCRKKGKASRVLRLLVDGKWWIDESGVTQIKERSSSLIKKPFQVIDYKPNLGLFEITTNDFAEWTPGRKFKSPMVGEVEQTISSVTFEIREGKLRLFVLNTDTPEDRLLKSIRALIRDEVYRLEHGTIVEYVITSAESMKIACKPSAGPDSGWPALSDVKLKAGLMGEVVKPTVGAKCLIIFMDNDPSLYRCIGVEGPNETTSFETSGNITATAGGIFKVCGGGNFVALANLVDANFTSLVTQFNTHIHPTPWGPSAPPIVPMPAYTPVACTKLKTD